jgi:hypothetical protein
MGLLFMIRFILPNFSRSENDNFKSIWFFSEYRGRNRRVPWHFSPHGKGRPDWERINRAVTDEVELLKLISWDVHPVNRRGR